MDEQLELLRRVAAAVGVTPDVGVTVGKIFVLYKSARPGGRAWQMERNLLKPFVVAFWRRPAATVTTSDWNEHRRRRRKETTRLGRPPSELTLNLELSAARRMFRWAMRKRLINERPLIDCKPVKTKTRRESWFTAEQVTQLIEGARLLRWRRQQQTFAALAAAMGDTGLRISEALSLRWDRITLRGTTPITGKGGKTRVVAFTPRTLKLLAELERHPSAPAVFCNWRTLRAYDPSTVRTWFRDVVRRAGLEGVKVDGDLALVPHCLRHSAASIADERGAPATWIQAMLGHAHLSTTMHYLHRSEDDNALRMAAIMAGRSGPRRAAGRLRASPQKEVVKHDRVGSQSFS